MTTQIPPQPVYSVQDLEYALCARSFPDFLERVYILEPPPGRGVIKFEIWPKLLEVITAISANNPDGKRINRLIALLKARQVGISWLMAAYVLWTALYHRGAVVLELSQSEKVSAVLLEKSRTILNLLPAHLKTAVGVDSATEISFPQMQSKIVALPSTERAGRSETATLVVQDEADYHEQLELNYTAIKPTIDAGGQLIMASTINKNRVSSLFRELFLGAPGNGYLGLFIGWMARPGRDLKWLEGVRDSIPVTAEMSPELYMEQEYPATAEEALAPSRVLSAFDQDALKAMLENCIDPIEEYNNTKIYQKWGAGRRYVAATDTSHGTGGDDAVTVILDAVTGLVVADIQSSLIGPEDLGYESVELLKLYKNPLWLIEDNDWGMQTINIAEQLSYPNLFYRKKGVAGWHNDKSTRAPLWGDGIEAIKKRWLIITSKAGISQFMTTIRNPKKDGRIEAMSGAHDDYPLAVCLAWYGREGAWSSGINAGIQKF